MAEERRRLTTWSAIAKLFDCDVRTVQRWAKERGLPVRRVPGGLRSSVFAYEDELRAWLEQSETDKGVRPTPLSGGGNGVPVKAAAQAPRRRISRRAVIGMASAVTAATVAAFRILTRKPEPERAVLTGNLLSVFDGIGRTLWTHRFPGQLSQPPESDVPWRVQVLDLEGSGRKGVLVTCSFVLDASAYFPSRDELFYFGPDGSLRWSLPCQPSLLDFNGRAFGAAWTYLHILPGVSPRGKTIWAALGYWERWPGCVLRVDAHGKSRVQFANAGMTNRLCPLPGTEGELLAIAGENNAFDLTCLAVIGANDPPSSSPLGGPARYRFANGPTGSPRHYILFPTNELTKAMDSPYAVLKNFDYHSGTLTADMSGGGVHLVYEFSDKLEARVVMPSTSYPLVHRRLEQEGRLKHTWAACPELAKPQILRHWRPETGWRDEPISWRLPTNTV